MGITVSKDYTIHYYEIDYKKRLHMTSLIDFLGDIATLQSENIGIGIDYLKEKNLAWVLYKWDIVVRRYPLFGDKITIKTNPHAYNKFYANRKFEVYDECGELIAYANSLWILVNTERKRPVRITKDLTAAYGMDENEDEVDTFGEIEALKHIQYESSFTVRYSDIDTNKHVNNAKYVGWAIESIPIDIILNHELSGIKVVYQKETTYGDTIKVLTEIIKEERRIRCLHRIEDKDGKELTVAETMWK
jgi:medium-chain acyl-[acyl-carrier-protein] hydrolase